MYAFFHGSSPVGQIRQISYIFLLDKKFGKPQMTCYMVCQCEKFVSSRHSVRQNSTAVRPASISLDMHHAQTRGAHACDKLQKSSQCKFMYSRRNHYVTTKKNIKLLDCVVEHEFIYELISYTWLIQSLFVFLCFDTQLSQSLTCDHTLVNTVIIVSEILA